MQNIFDMLIGYMVGGYFIALGIGIKGMIPDQLRGKKVFLVVGIAVCALNFAFSLYEGRHRPAKLTPQMVVSGLRDRLSLPVQMDPFMRLETVSADEGNIIYNFSISVTTAEAYNKKIAEVREFMGSKGCTMKDSKFLLEAGINMQLNYAAPVQLGLSDTQIIIKPKDCGYAVADTTAQAEARNEDVPR